MLKMTVGQISRRLHMPMEYVWCIINNHHIDSVGLLKVGNIQTQNPLFDFDEILRNGCVVRFDHIRKYIRKYLNNNDSNFLPGEDFTGDRAEKQKNDPGVKNNQRVAV